MISLNDLIVNSLLVYILLICYLFSCCFGFIVLDLKLFRVNYFGGLLANNFFDDFIFKS